MVEFREIEWNEYNIEKIEEHGIRSYEAEELFESPYILLRCKKKRGDHLEKRRILLGVTLGGRYVFLVFEDKGKGIARPISARDMDMEDDERRFYEEKVG